MKETEEIRLLQEALEFMTEKANERQRRAEDLTAELANEREWTSALGNDNRALISQLNAIATALGIKNRNDHTDLVTPITRLAAELKSANQALALAELDLQSKAEEAEAVAAVYEKTAAELEQVKRERDEARIAVVLHTDHIKSVTAAASQNAAERDAARAEAEGLKRDLSALSKVNTELRAEAEKLRKGLAELRENEERREFYLPEIEDLRRRLSETEAALLSRKLLHEIAEEEREAAEADRERMMAENAQLRAELANARR